MTYSSDTGRDDSDRNTIEGAADDSMTTSVVPQRLPVTRGNTLQLMQDYLDQSPQLSEDTLETYRHHLIRFYKWWSASPRAQNPLTGEVVSAYRAYLNRQAFTYRSRSSRLAAVRSWCSYLQTEGHLSLHPFTDLPSFKKPDSITGGFLTEEEAVQFKDSFQHDQILSYRDYVIARLMLKTGLREIEVCQANIGDLGPFKEGGILFLRSKGKRNKEEEVVLLPELYQDIQTYLERRRQLQMSTTPDQPLFVGHRENIQPTGQRLSTHEVRRRLTLALRAAGITRPSISVRSLRHTAAILAFTHEAPLPAVQTMMRHEDPRTTRIYKRLADRLQRRGETYLEFL